MRSGNIGAPVADESEASPCLGLTISWSLLVSLGLSWSRSGWFWVWGLGLAVSVECLAFSVLWPVAWSSSVEWCVLCWVWMCLDVSGVPVFLRHLCRLSRSLLSLSWSSWFRGVSRVSVSRSLPCVWHLGVSSSSVWLWFSVFCFGVTFPCPVGTRFQSGD